jgi:cellulose synthase (UDP-forming)
MKQTAIEPVLSFATPSRWLLAANATMALIYISWWFDFANAGNPILYCLLLFGEIYHVTMALLFCHSLWRTGESHVVATELANKSFVEPSVDVFITVCGEPVDIVRQTALAAKNLDYSNHHVYLLNDGKVAHKDNWQDMEKLAKELSITCITREVGGGAKAGNINHALAQTKAEIVVILDADMVPSSTFLTAVTPYFADPKLGFVQTPQYYKNFARNSVASGAWEQQEFFFGPIMRGKNGRNAAFICGTNVAIRRTALLQAGGMCEDNIAEDFLTSLTIHQQGWTSHYLPKVYCQGLAPEDLLSYYKQQLRWARGSLEVLFGENPLFKTGLTWGQKLQYLASALYYFNGPIVVIGLVMPLIYLFFNIQPVLTSSTSFALFFAPFMFISLYTLFIASGESLTFRAMSFSQASWTLQLQALYSLITKQSMGFAVTPKAAQQGNFLRLAYPHIAYILLAIIGVGVSVYRNGLSPSLLANVAWVLFNAIMFMPFILASYDWSSLFTSRVKISQNIATSRSTVSSQMKGAS